MVRFVIWFLALLGTATSLPAIQDDSRDGSTDEGRRSFKIVDDMIIDTNYKSGLRDPGYRWVDGIVPYVISDQFTNRERLEIEIAMLRLKIAVKQCISFVRRSDERDYVAIVPGPGGCSAVVGRNGGQQAVNLEKGSCTNNGTIIHELIHALGFFHEQSRPDRDAYVTINSFNVINDAKVNFEKCSESECTTFDVPYDYDSIMHYPAYAFALDPKVPTIVPKDPAAKIGQRDHLSEYDMQKIMKMYQCDGASTAELSLAVILLLGFHLLVKISSVAKLQV